jgi:hypothetical protein
MTIAMPDLNAWAANQLEVDGGLPAGELRRALLEKLAGCDFLPPRSWGPAFSVLARQAEPMSIPTMSMAWTNESTDCAQGVESLATSLFELPLEQRESKWNELRERCQFFPALAGRLDGLKKLLVLSIDCQEGASAECQRLAREIASVLVRSRNERDNEWRGLIDRWRDPSGAPWFVTSELRSRNPGLADLARIHLRCISLGRSGRSNSSFGDSGVFPDASIGPDESRHYAKDERFPWLDMRKRESLLSRMLQYSLAFGVVAVVIGLVIGFMSHGNPFGLEAQSPYPRISHDPPKTFELDEKTKTEFQKIMKQIEQDRQKGTKKAGVAPAPEMPQPRRPN